MKKILIAFNGAHFPTSSLDFAVDMNNDAPIMLTGIFLPSVDYANFLNFTYYGLAVPPFYIDEYADDKQQIEKNKEAFKAFCSRHNIKYRIHDEIMEDIIKGLCVETRFADMLVLNSLYFSEGLGDMVQDDYIEKTLHKAECPIVLLPAAYDAPENIVIAYDGSPSSMFAIKQFVYTLPHLTDLNTLIVYIGKEDHDIPSWELIKEYAPNHFNQLAIFKLDIDARKYLSSWMEERGATMLVCGAFGRSNFSQLFKETFVKELIQEAETPLYIAHP